MKLLGDHLNMSNALNDKDKDQVEEKLILAARHLAKQNDEKQPEDDLDISGELLNDMVIWVDKFPREVYKKKISQKSTYSEIIILFSKKT